MWAKVRGLDVSNILHKAIIKYQKEAREQGNDDVKIRIIDNLHYIKGRDGQIHNNPALFHQLHIYGIPQDFRIRTNSKYLPKLNLDTIRETPEHARERLNF
jgi:hypothetical protein